MSDKIIPQYPSKKYKNYVKIYILIKENADKLIARGKELLLANKVWGGIVGIIMELIGYCKSLLLKKMQQKNYDNYLV